MLRHNDNKTAAVKKHLILFFDVNGTIMLEDSKQNKDKETAICQMLAESYSSCWKPGMNKNMTYRKFVEEHMHPGDDNDPVIEAARHASYRNFLTFLKESNHSLHAVVNESYQKFQADFSSKNKIFDSFVALIEHLEHEKIPYTVIFRTFGNDI
jgi:hypothetical protein